MNDQLTIGERIANQIESYLSDPRPRKALAEDIDSYICDLKKREAKMREALAGLLADITEYQTINKLGGENNHWQVRAREALASEYPDA